MSCSVRCALQHLLILFILTIRNSEIFLNISHTHCIQHLEQLWKVTFPGGNPDLCYHLHYPYSPSMCEAAAHQLHSVLLLTKCHFYKVIILTKCAG